MQGLKGLVNCTNFPATRDSGGTRDLNTSNRTSTSDMGNSGRAATLKADSRRIRVTQGVLRRRCHDAHGVSTILWY